MSVRVSLPKVVGGGWTAATAEAAAGLVSVPCPASCGEDGVPWDSERSVGLGGALIGGPSSRPRSVQCGGEPGARVLELLDEVDAGAAGHQRKAATVLRGERPTVGGERRGCFLSPLA
jgi:hypothetical protein